MEKPLSISEWAILIYQNIIKPRRMTVSEHPGQEPRFTVFSTEDKPCTTPLVNPSEPFGAINSSTGIVEMDLVKEIQKLFTRLNLKSNMDTTLPAAIATAHQLAKICKATTTLPSSPENINICETVVHTMHGNRAQRFDPLAVMFGAPDLKSRSYVDGERKSAKWVLVLSHGSCSSYKDTEKPLHLPHWIPRPADDHRSIKWVSALYNQPSAYFEAPLSMVELDFYLNGIRGRSNDDYDGTSLRKIWKRLPELAAMTEIFLLSQKDFLLFSPSISSIPPLPSVPPPQLSISATNKVFISFSFSFSFHIFFSHFLFHF